MPEHVLDGCRPTPLAHYLKALGVLRLVAEQRDPRARGSWRNERFVLSTDLERDELTRFFLEEYRPTPIVAPWNGGSGFHPKDNRQALEAIVASPSDRFEPYRTTIAEAERALDRLGIHEKVSKEDKPVLLEACRATFSDGALPWVDAAFVLTDDGAKYPPLLGTGGNDGRLDFTNNFMQRLLDVVDPSTGSATPDSASLLGSALDSSPSDRLVKNAAIGQFLPGSAGGANATTGFVADSLINPWDFVLMLEGAVLFAAAATRKLEHGPRGTLAYPFTVRQAAVGYASASDDDETSARAEMWLPLWRRFASVTELGELFSEGRARVGGRPARNGVDFARAVATLGVDRGLSAFERYGFQVRNGLSYFAVPLGRVEVRTERAAGLLLELDSWLDGFRRAASGPTAPASAKRALRELETAILALCQRGDAPRVQQGLVALGRCERALAGSLRWTVENRVRPIPPLSPEWLSSSDDGSVELRLAASLASLHGSYRGPEDRQITLTLRHHLEPVRFRGRGDRLRVEIDVNADGDVRWTSGAVVASINSIFARRLTRAIQSGHPTYADQGRPAMLSDIADFIAGRIDEARLGDLLWGCSLLDGSRSGAVRLAKPEGTEDTEPGALFALLKLCYAGAPVKALTIPLVPYVHRLAALGQGGRAAQQAVRRLRGSGLVPAVGTLHADGEIAERTAAALLYPMSPHSLQRLADLVLRPQSPDPHLPTAAAAGAAGATS